MKSIDRDAESFLADIGRLEDNTRNGNIIPGAEKPIAMTNEEADRIVRAVENLLAMEGLYDKGDKNHYCAQLEEVSILCTDLEIQAEAKRLISYLDPHYFTKKT